MVHRSADGKSLLLSDSLSCLQSLQNRDLSHPLIAEILCYVHEILSCGHTIVFMWVPSHMGLTGNSAADTAAKAALLLPVSNLTIPHSDYNQLIRSHVLKQWQQRWNLDTQNKLHAIEPTVNVVNSYRLPRRDEIIIHRLRIGHTYLTHGHLLRGESPPQCPSCQVQLSVEHILLHCVCWTNVRDSYNTVSTLADLFQKLHLAK